MRMVRFRSPGTECSGAVILGMVFWSVAHVCAGVVPISVSEPSGVARNRWPVTSGIPLAEGVFSPEMKAALYRADGNEQALQFEPIAYWPDGSVRWLLVDFQVDLKPNECRMFSLRYGSDVRPRAVSSPVNATVTGNEICLNTGPLELKFGKLASLLGQVGVDLNHDGQISADETVLAPVDSGIKVTDQDGRQYLLAAPDKVEVEASGPLRFSVRLEGRHKNVEGDPLFTYIVRLHAYAGRPEIRCCYTFVNDSQDSLMRSVREIELFARPQIVNPEANRKNWSVLDGQKQPLVESGRRTLFQWDESHYETDGTPAGERAQGWTALGGDRLGLAIGFKEFWQHWPKSASISPGELTFGICPQLPPDLYANKSPEEENKLYYHLRDGVHTFKVGMAKTHEVWFRFLTEDGDAISLAEYFRATEEPLLATCAPDYVCSTRAAGMLRPADRGKYFGYDAWVETAFKGHLKRREEEREYGLLNFGDWYGERQYNWGNLEYDLAHGLFLQYLRTGDRKYFTRAAQAARHHIDVDVVHATNRHLKNPYGSDPQVGEIWIHALNHTGGYYDASPLMASRTYQMGYSTNFGHVWVAGDLDYYHLTGDRRAREVAIQMADAMVRHIPTKYGTHIRALGWPMILLLAAYESTGDQKYLDAARKNWLALKQHLDWENGWVVQLAFPGHCKHEEDRCRGNVPFMEGLTLCALARYHRLTNDPEVLRAITVGIDQMIRECWQDDLKTLRYTACPMTFPDRYSLFMLTVEAFAYESAATGNQEHQRILAEGFRSAIYNEQGDIGKLLGQMIHFAPHCLYMLEPSSPTNQ